jgi:hypothetical protein
MYDDDDDDDDDDDNDEEPRQGRIYYSGINPNAERADYALPIGEAALVGGDAEFEQHISVPWSRRKLLGLGLGLSVLGAGAGVGIGAMTAFASNGERDPGEGSVTGPVPRSVPSAWAVKYLNSAREAADGSIKNLVHSYRMYIMIVESDGGQDPKLWEGMRRLSEFVKYDRGRTGFKIAKRLLTAFRYNPPPRNLAYIEMELEQFVSVWNKTNR